MGIFLWSAQSGNDLPFVTQTRAKFDAVCLLLIFNQPEIEGKNDS
jgi:hypothetical protein